MSRPVVVIPTYNEVINIGPMLERVLSLPSRFDILVVDDGSPDGTANIVRTHIEFEQRVHLLERAKKLGLATAYRDGFTWALKRDYTHVCEMDADLSHNPVDLERLLSATEQADVAIGCRYMPGGGIEGWSRHRLLLSRGANLYARIATRLPYRDLTGGFKCFRREALAKLPLDAIHTEGYAFQIEATVLLARQGIRISEVPIVFRERLHGISKISRSVIWEAIWVVLRLAFQTSSSVVRAS